MKSKSTGRPAGRPEIQASRACPCDSPAVKKRSILTRPPVQSHMNSLIGCAKAIARIEDIAMEVFRRALLSRAFLVTPARSVVQDFSHASTLFAGPLLARGSFARRKRKASHSIGAAEVRPAACRLSERGIAQLLHRYQNSRILRYQRTAGEKATCYPTAGSRQIVRGLALAAGRAGPPARAKRSCNG